MKLHTSNGDIASSEIIIRITMMTKMTVMVDDDESIVNRKIL